MVTETLRSTTSEGCIKNGVRGVQDISRNVFAYVYIIAWAILHGAGILYKQAFANLLDEYIIALLRICFSIPPSPLGLYARYL